MKKFFLTPVLILGILIFQGCDKDDLPTPGGNKKVETTFNNMYPNAGYVEWEKKGDFWVADFRQNNTEMEAWFNVNGEWHQTETDVLFSTLPETVKTAFQSGEYNDWRIDDIDMFEYKNTSNVYVLDVEKSNKEYDLYYSTDGTLVNAIIDRS